jgi:hypothetical protein
MPREKFNVGEAAEVNCVYVENGKRVTGWLAGAVIEADHRMAAVKFTTDVFSSNGWLIPDRILWCAHGSSNIRRPKRQTTDLAN